MPPFLTCQDGDTQPCNTGLLGICAAGTQTCNGNVWGPCIQDQLAQAESCNGLDDNCDGQIDEGGVCLSCNDGDTQACVTPFPGECAAGTQTCGGGVWGPCVQNTPAWVETCDGLDNDCDGAVDEGGVCSVCVNGQTQACIVPGLQGLCAFGLETCSGGVWGACQQTYIAQPESCNGLDDNCDGQVDEGGVCAGCVNGTTQPCNTGLLGECAAGTQTCSGGVWGQCVQDTPAWFESCDGLDNDCDGAVDEGGVCGGICADGQQQACDTGLDGICSQGLETCMGGAWGPCVQIVFPQAETCNGLDDNCDGNVDEGGVCLPCVNGTTQPCSTGLPGICQFGTQTCVGNVWDVCVQQNPATAESCNGVDDDCDGSVDEAGVCSGPAADPVVQLGANPWEIVLNGSLMYSGVNPMAGCLEILGEHEASPTCGNPFFSWTPGAGYEFTGPPDVDGYFYGELFCSDGVSRPDPGCYRFSAVVCGTSNWLQYDYNADGGQNMIWCGIDNFNNAVCSFSICVDAAGNITPNGNGP